MGTQLASCVLCVPRSGRAEHQAVTEPRSGAFSGAGVGQKIGNFPTTRFPASLTAAGIPVVSRTLLAPRDLTAGEILSAKAAGFLSLACGLRDDSRAYPTYALVARRLMRSAALNYRRNRAQAAAEGVR